MDARFEFVVVVASNEVVCSVVRVRGIHKEVVAWFGFNLDEELGVTELDTRSLRRLPHYVIVRRRIAADVRHGGRKGCPACSTRRMVEGEARCTRLVFGPLVED